MSDWLSYEDPECEKDETGAHRVSRLRAGQAFNDLCRMLGGRWPDAKMEQGAPIVYQFFMALLADPPKDETISPEVVGYTTAGMLRIAKDLPLTGRIGAKCKQDDRWNVPLMTVAEHERIVSAMAGEASHD